MAQKRLGLIDNNLAYTQQTEPLAFSCPEITAGFTWSIHIL